MHFQAARSGHGFSPLSQLSWLLGNCQWPSVALSGSTRYSHSTFSTASHALQIYTPVPQAMSTGQEFRDTCWLSKRPLLTVVVLCCWKLSCISRLNTTWNRLDRVLFVFRQTLSPLPSPLSQHAHSRVQLHSPNPPADFFN